MELRSGSLISPEYVKQSLGTKGKLLKEVPYREYVGNPDPIDRKAWMRLSRSEDKPDLIEGHLSKDPEKIDSGLPFFLKAPDASNNFYSFRFPVPADEALENPELYQLLADEIRLSLDYALDLAKEHDKSSERIARLNAIYQDT